MSFDLGGQGSLLGFGQRGDLFFVQPKVVVISRQHPGLVDGRPLGLKQEPVHARFPQQPSYRFSLGIASHHPYQGGAGSQPGQVEGHVGGSPQRFGLALDFQQGDRGFVGHAQGPASQVGVQHDVAEHQHPHAGDPPNALQATLDLCFHGGLGLESGPEPGGLRLIPSGPTPFPAAHR